MQSVKKRYWVSWYSGYYESEGCMKPPFQLWISGSRDRNHPDGGDELVICAVIDAESETTIWRAIAKYFPDYQERFCNETAQDWQPNAERFPDFENNTSLTP